MISRRSLIATSLAMAGYGIGPARAAPLDDDFRGIEAASGGRLGVAVIDTRDGAQTGNRAGERFPMCSTFKWLAAAAVLARVDAGRERLDRVVHFSEADLVTYSPITKDKVASGITLDALCVAAITLSDNTAGNLLLASIGGPAGLTAYARTLGDPVTRLDRIETELNEATPGDPRDTTAPGAMAENLRKVILGDALSAASRERLTGWLLGNRTGGQRMRAGVPEGWRVGDKTGGGGHGSNNDVGVIWPPGRAPLVVAVYLTETKTPAELSNATHAAVARAVAAALVH